MRRLFVTLIALLLALGAAAAPATAKRDKPAEPAKPAPTLAFGHPAGSEPYAGYQPAFGLCVADVYVQVDGAGRRNLVTFEADSADGIVSHSQDQTLLWGHPIGLLFSYDFPCASEIELEITHVVTLQDRKGTELASIQATPTMNFVVHE